MKILALNCGSSSVKYMLYDWEKRDTLAKGTAERVGIDGSILTHEAHGKKNKIEKSMPNHAQALELILKLLVDGDGAVLKDISEIAAVAHRVVHGGQKFVKSVLIDDEIINAIEELTVLAPLHNPPNLTGIRAARGAMPKTPQVAVFDTAFHQTMPEHAYIYPVPHEWYDKYQVRRYGFHGTSHLYVSKRAAAMLGKKAADCNIITLHVGNGASVSAIRNGVCVDTSMGMTPLEGVVMGTRCGDIDPSIPYFIENVTGATSGEVNSILNKKSGLLGITEKYTDRRDIEAGLGKDKLCDLAFQIECYRLKQYIGKYMAVLGRVDAIVFTAGAGENQPSLRELSTEGLNALGIKLDVTKNANIRSKNGETDLSASDSKIKIFMIPTDEEQVLIEDVVGVLNGTYTDHMHYKYSFL